MKILTALVMAVSFLSSHSCPAEPMDFHREVMDGGKMDAAKAAKLESVLEDNPDDLSSRTRLLGYYFIKGRAPGEALNNRRKHVL